MARPKATVDITGDNAKLREALSQSVGSIESFGRRVKQIGGLVAAAFAIDKVFDFGKLVVGLASQQVAAETKLEAVLLATGHAAGYTSDQLKQIASDLQLLTTTGDETTLEMMSLLATFRNVRGDVFRDSVKTLMDMTAVMGGGAERALQLGKALNDPLRGLSALTDVGITFDEQQKKTVARLVAVGDVAGAQRVILEELANQFGGAAEAMADTFGGQLQQAKNRIGDVGESIGMMLIPVLKSLLPLLGDVTTAAENLVPVFERWFDVTKRGFSVIGEYVEPVFTAILEGSLIAWTAIETYAVRGTELWLAAIMKFQLGFTAAFEDVKYWLTSSLPQYLEWFADNWTSVLEDVASATQSIFSNMWTNITDFIAAVQSALQGDGFDFKWTALLEGFEATMAELPTIASRQLSDVEKGLRAQIDALEVDVGSDFLSRLDYNRKFLADLFKKQDGDRIDLTHNASDKYTGLTGQTPKGTGGGAGVEDLTALNKRIQAAQFKKDPAAEAIEKADSAQAARDQKRDDLLAGLQSDRLDTLIAGEIPAPDVNTAPEVSAQAVEVPAPEVNAQAVEVPAPEVNAQAVEVPAPEVNAQAVEVPAPEVNAQAVEVPAPEVNAQAVEVPAPEVSAQAVEVPAPEVNAQAVEVPAPEVNAQAVEVPAPEVNAQAVEVPAPEVNAQAVEVPAPEVNAQAVEVPAPETNIQDILSGLASFIGSVVPEVPAARSPDVGLPQVNADVAGMTDKQFDDYSTRLATARNAEFLAKSGIDTKDIGDKELRKHTEARRLFNDGVDPDETRLLNKPVERILRALRERAGKSTGLPGTEKQIRTPQLRPRRLQRQDNRVNFRQRMPKPQVRQMRNVRLRANNRLKAAIKRDVSIPAGTAGHGDMLDKLYQSTISATREMVSAQSTTNKHLAAIAGTNETISKKDTRARAN